MLLRFPLEVEVSGLGAHRCACGFEYLQSRFFRSYRSNTSESNPLQRAVAWNTSCGRCAAAMAKQHLDPHLHPKPQRGNVTAAGLSAEDGVHRNMLFSRLNSGTFLFVFVFAAALALSAQDPSPPPAKAPAQTIESNRLTIEVTGGEKAVPVENASVYVKYVEEHVIKKDKKLELNVKTNREGVAHVAEAPLGRALIQIIAEGWKTYGRWYDITDPHQVIKVRLERPPKWY